MLKMLMKGKWKCDVFVEVVNSSFEDECDKELFFNGKK